jgi:hypothetical protein
MSATASLAEEQLEVLGSSSVDPRAIEDGHDGTPS